MREGARALRAQAWALGICGLECHHLAVDSVASLHRLLDIQDELCRPPCPSKDAEDSGDGGGERLREANREQGWERERERDRERRTGGCAPRESMGETSEVGGTRGNWKERGERKVKLEPAVEDSEDDSSALVALCVFAFSRVPSNSGSGGGRSKTSPCSVDVRAWIAKVCPGCSVPSSLCSPHLPSHFGFLPLSSFLSIGHQFQPSVASLHSSAYRGRVACCLFLLAIAGTVSSASMLHHG